MASHFAPFTGELWWIGLAVLGIVVGIVAGMFGIGGGFLLIPVLNMIFGIPIDVAVGTGLCMTIGTGIAALRRHRRLKHGEEKLSWIMLGGAVVGVRAGAALVGYLSRQGIVDVGGRSIPAVKLWISAFYVVILAGVSISMILDSRNPSLHEDQVPGPLSTISLPPYIKLPAANRMLSLPILAYLGLLLGFLSGVMGIGGGVMFMPILVYGIGMSMKMAAGTGVLLLVVTSTVGTISHAELGHVHLGLAMVLLAGSTVAAPMGATLTGRLSGANLRGIFGYLVLITAGAVLWDLLRSMKVV